MNNLIGKMLVFIFTLLMLALVWLSSSIVWSVVYIYIYALVLVGINCKNGAADPRVFPLAFMAIYFTFFPLRALFFGSGNLPFDEGVLLESLRLQSLAMATFVVVSNVIVFESRQRQPFSFFDAGFANISSERILFIFALPFVLVPMLLIIKSGAGSKREILDNLSAVKILSDLALLVVTVLVFLRAARIGRAFCFDLFIIGYLGLCLFYVLLTGERDILFKVLFGFLIIYFDQRRSFGFFKMVVIFSALVLVVPISQYFKGVLLSGEVAFDRDGWDLILYSEFMSASRNFYSLLFFGVDQDISFLLSDISRAFVPTMITGETDVQSSVAWFERVFRAENGFSGTSGWGFTIVGFGYIVGGIFGIVAIMVFYASLLGALYNLRWRSIYWYAFYILALAAFVYVIRADLANLLSLLFKISGLAMMLVYLAHLMMRRKIAS